MIKLEPLARLVHPVLAATYIDPLNTAMVRFDITTPRQQGAFLAQLIHESQGFRSIVENLNYTPVALLATFNSSWTKRFTPEAAVQYGRTEDHPADLRMIANIAYANRMGNGSIESGDGWRYRGRGPIQLTGKANYRACGDALGFDLVASPEILLEPFAGCAAAAWFWAAGNRTGRSLNALANVGRIDDISKVVNGGGHGLDARRELTEAITLAVWA